MAAAGLQPGPRAYHALVIANVKAGDAVGALAAAQEGYKALATEGVSSRQMLA